MKITRNKMFVFMLQVTCFLSVFVCVNEVESKELPDKLTVAILLKVIDYSENNKKKDRIRIHVISNEGIENTIRDYIKRDKVLNKRVIVEGSDKLPDKAVDIIFLSSMGRASKVVAYTRDHEVMSVTNNVDVTAKGVSLTIFDDEGVPGILINTVASRYESLLWSPEILEIAKVLEAVELTQSKQ